MSQDHLYLNLKPEEALSLWLILGEYKKIKEKKFAKNPTEGLQNQINSISILSHRVFELIKPIPDFSDIDKIILGS